jgi:hypothetical protein
MAAERKCNVALGQQEYQQPPPGISKGEEDSEHN